MILQWIGRGLVRLALGVILLPSVFLAAPASATSLPTSSSHAKVFVGFGDSVAAGFGLPVTNPAMGYEVACGRSDAGYVNEAAAALGARAINLACAGATTWHGILGTQETASGVAVPSQLQQAAVGPRPYYASVTIGANDIRWTTFLGQCIQSNCATEANTKAFHALLHEATIGLKASLMSISVLRPQKVLVTGYYDPFAGSAAVAGQFGLSEDEIVWYQARLTELNHAINETTERFAKATFVPIAFTDPALVILDPANPGIFHPTLAGQHVIARAVAMVAEAH